MPAKVSVNNLTVVHATSDGVTVAFPDVCKTPAPPAPPIPIPYPNVAKSSDAAQTAKTVKCDGNPLCVKDSNFMLSTGDEAGSLMGVASNKVKGKAEFVNFSFDVQAEGKNVPRALDPMLHNDKNTPPAPLMQAPLPPAALAPAPDDECVFCSMERGEAGGGGGGGGGGSSNAQDAAAAVERPAGGAPAAAATPAADARKIVTVEWNQIAAWCSDRVGFGGRVENVEADESVPAEITIEGAAASPVAVGTSVRTWHHRGSWEIKDVLPPKAGAHFVTSAKCEVTVEGAKSTRPLTLKFAPSARKTDYAHGYHHFSVTAQDYELTVEVPIEFVKGWGANVVKLGFSVSPFTGGRLSWNPFDGYRWMKKIGVTDHFWDGSKWQPLPAGFVLDDRNHICLGIVKDGEKFVQPDYGAEYPERLVDWDVDSPDSQARLANWKQTIDQTWTGKFDLRSAACKSADPKCCRYRVVMKSQFVKRDKYTDGCIVLAHGNIRSNTSLFFIGEPRAMMAAHEVGHYLGNPDEYPGSRVDEDLNEDGAVKGIDADSIMGVNLSTVKKRHFRTMGRVLQQALAREHGMPFVLKAVRV